MLCRMRFRTVRMLMKSLRTMKSIADKTQNREDVDEGCGAGLTSGRQQKKYIEGEDLLAVKVGTQQRPLAWPRVLIHICLVMLCPSFCYFYITYSGILLWTQADISRNFWTWRIFARDTTPKSSNHFHRRQTINRAFHGRSS